MIVTCASSVHPAFRGKDVSHRDNAGMVRILVVSLFALLGAGCSPELNWRELRFEEAGVTQLFPCKPVRQQRKVLLAGRPQVLVLQVCDAGGVTWALAHTQASDPAEVSAVLQALADAAHANVGVARSSVQPQAVPGATAHAASGRYRYSGQAPDGRRLEAAVLLYARGPVVVQLTALGPRLAAEAVDTFLTSARAGT
jgi:hypothetical protein